MLIWHQNIHHQVNEANDFGLKLLMSILSQSEEANFHEGKMGPKGACLTLACQTLLTNVIMIRSLPIDLECKENSLLGLGRIGDAYI